MPPGSRDEVCLPSKFGYGPGLIKFNRRKCCDKGDHKDDDSHDSPPDSSSFAWEELDLVTPDNVKLQAYWIKAPSKLEGEASIRQRITEKASDVPFTILYMQANAGNIVSTIAHMYLTILFVGSQTADS